MTLVLNGEVQKSINIIKQNRGQENSQFFEAELLLLIDNFKKESCSFSTLSNYSTLIDAALKNNYISKSDLDTLNHWRKDPATWKSNA